MPHSIVSLSSCRIWSFLSCFRALPNLHYRCRAIPAITAAQHRVGALRKGDRAVAQHRRRCCPMAASGLRNTRGSGCAILGVEVAQYRGSGLPNPGGRGCSTQGVGLAQPEKERRLEVAPLVKQHKKNSILLNVYQLKSTSNSAIQ